MRKKFSWSGHSRLPSHVKSLFLRLVLTGLTDGHSKGFDVMLLWEINNDLCVTKTEFLSISSRISKFSAFSTTAAAILKSFFHHPRFFPRSFNSSHNGGTNRRKFLWKMMPQLGSWKKENSPNQAHGGKFPCTKNTLWITPHTIASFALRRRFCAYAFSGDFNFSLGKLS